MLLELLLTFAIGRKDVKPLAEELIRVFGSLSKVLSVSQDELAKVKGLGQSSVALLKVVDFIATGAIKSVISKPPPAKVAAGATQQKLFQKLPNEEKPNPSSSNTPKKQPAESVRPAVAERKPVSPGNKNERSVSPPSSRPSKKKIISPKSTRRKFQVSNGYLLEFDQLARILHFLLENRQAKKINRKVLQEDTGLADRG